MYTLWSIGHSNHEEKAFISLLKKHDIECLIEVRTNPRSRWCPQFNVDALMKSTKAAGIKYIVDFGNPLGGKGFVEPEIRENAVAKVANIAMEKRCAIMCSEGDFHKCHRWTSLSPLFERIGFRVLHIQKDGSLVENSESSIPKSKPQMAMDDLLSLTAGSTKS